MRHLTWRVCADCKTRVYEDFWSLILFDVRIKVCLRVMFLQWTDRGVKVKVVPPQSLRYLITSPIQHPYWHIISVFLLFLFLMIGTLEIEPKRYLFFNRKHQIYECNFLWFSFPFGLSMMHNGITNFSTSFMLMS